MSALRHPVVITPLEEDFKRIGLIKEEEEPAASADEENFDDDEEVEVEEDEEIDEGYQTIGKKGLPSGKGGKTGTGSPGKNRRSGGSSKSLKMGYKTGGDRLHKQSGSRKDPALDYGRTEDEEWDDDDEPVSEAEAFAEGFDEEWEAMDEAGVEELVLDSEDMDELESMGRRVSQQEGYNLHVSYITESQDEDDEDLDEDDEDLDEGGMYSSKKRGGKKKGAPGKAPGKKEAGDGAYESVSDAMDAIESLYQERPESIEESVPAFANIALISEMLANFFNETRQVTEDEDYGEISQSFAEMAKNAAGVVEVLSEDEPDSIDPDRVQELFGDYLESLLGGLEMYSEISEALDNESDDEDLDEGGKGKYGKKKAGADADEEEDDEDDEEGNE